MKLWMILCFLFLSITHVYADSYIVMDGEDLTVYRSRNQDAVQSIASVSKVMTAIVAIEKGELTDSWVVKEEIRNSYGSMIYLQQNQVVNLIDLLYGLLLESGNDAADAIAYHVGGNDTSQFIFWMNEKAKELNMTNTKYQNPSGLDDQDGGNLSTVYDQALLMRYCLQNDIFLQITQTKYYMNQLNQQYVNHNKLLWNFPYTIAGKTGYTLLAQHTLVSAARKEDITCIVVSFEMGEEAYFHQRQYIDFYNEIQAYTIIREQMSKVVGKMVVIDRPFVIHGTKEEFQNGHLSMFMDEDNKQLVVKWQSDVRTNCMYYDYL